MNKVVLLLSLLAVNVTPSLAASQPTFSIVANTPTSIVLPANRHAYVQYTVTNNTNLTRALTMVPIPNVTQLTTDASQCGNPFTLAKKQSCKLTLYVDGALQSSTYSGGPVVCVKKSQSNTPDPFLCSQPSPSMRLSIYPTAAVTPTPNKLYVSNWDGGSISLCYINNQSGDLAHCLVTAVSDTFLNPEALAIPINSAYLFVANIGGGMSSCLMDDTSGELSGCGNAIHDASIDQIHAPDGIAFDGSDAYISNSGPEPSNQGVTMCTVNGASLQSCSFSQGTASFAVPSDLAIFNNGVYVTNFESLTTYCLLNGALCEYSGSITGTGALLNQPEGLFITSLFDNYAYFTNHGNNTVTLCTVANATTFSSCTNTEGHFSGFGNLSILSSVLKAFIPSGLKTMAVCNVNYNDGTLNNCVNSTEMAFNNPSGLVISGPMG